MARKQQQPAAPKVVVRPVDVALAWKMLAGTSEGQIVLGDLVRKFGFTRQSTFTPGGFVNGIDAAFKEGQRTVTIYIGRMLDADPAAFEETEGQEGVN